MSILFVILSIPFLAKVCWNLGLAFGVVLDAFRGIRRDPTRGVSLMPFVDLGSLCIATLASLANVQEFWFMRPTGIAALGAGMVIGSYALLLVAGWCTGRIQRRQDAQR